RPLKGGSQVTERGLWLAEVDGDRAKCLQHPDSEQPVAVVRALERAEQGEEQLARASRVATSTRRGRELVIDRVRETVIVKLCREALRDREIAMSLALPLDAIERPCTRDMQAAALAARERVTLEKGVGVSDAVRRVRSRRERRDAVDVELQFAAGAFDPGVLHEIGRRLRELRRPVFERLHRRPDLAELDRADMSSCVVRRAELVLAQPGGEARLAQPSAELAQRGRLRGDAAPPSARGHGAKRYAGPGVASTPNRQHDM